VTPENEALYRSWQRKRKAGGYAELPRNRQALERLDRHCGGRPLTELGRGDLLGFVGDGLADMSESGRATYFSSCRAFYNWAASDEEGLLDKSPMRGMAQPKVSKRPTPVPGRDHIAALLASVERDRTPMGRRDTAMIRLMLDTGGPRASEVATMLIAGRPHPAGTPRGLGIDLARDTVTVAGKGGKVRTWPIAAKTASAAERWLRARDATAAGRAHARLWTTFRSTQRPLTYSGVEGILQRRCEAAGVAHLHPHQLRHYSYHWFLKAGGQRLDAMQLYGWDDEAMPRHYAAALAEERSIEAGHALAIGDQW
jgi:site-specific recombinase XerC